MEQEQQDASKSVAEEKSESIMEWLVKIHF